jgi:hypothetical protein
MKYLADCNSIEEAKKSYRKLAFENHPDKGGSVEAMQEINTQYKAYLKGKNYDFANFKTDHDFVKDILNEFRDKGFGEPMDKFFEYTGGETAFVNLTVNLGSLTRTLREKRERKAQKEETGRSAPMNIPNIRNATFYAKETQNLKALTDGNEPDNTDEVRIWTEMNRPIGERLGFPDCCIKEFCNQPPKSMTGNPTTSDMTRYNSACIGGIFTGFVPCIKHAKEIEIGAITLESLINLEKRDLAFPKFPNA